MAFIKGIDANTPGAGDPVSGGDEQFRTLKSDLQTSFPEIDAEVKVNTLAMNTKMPLITSAESLASVIVIDAGYSPGNVLRYYDGGTFDIALQAAFDQQDQAGGADVFIPAGTFSFGATITYGKHPTVRGSGPQRTLLEYTGATTALAPADVASQNAYGVLKDFSLDDLGTGLVGLDMQEAKDWVVSNLRIASFVENVVVTGAAASSGNAVYNRFFNVEMRNAAGISLRLGGAPGGVSINENEFYGCRIANNLQAVQITECNGNKFYGCAIEQNTRITGTAGIELIGPNTNYTRLIACRFENNVGGGFAISEDSGCSNTTYVGTQMESSGGPLDLNGQARTWVGANQVGSQPNETMSRIQGSNGPSNIMIREPGGNDGEHPVLRVYDSNGGSGSPQTFQVDSEREGDNSLSRSASFRQKGVPQFEIGQNGILYTNQVTGGSSSPPATIDGKLELFDPVTKLSVGFIPIYTTLT